MFSSYALGPRGVRSTLVILGVAHATASAPRRISPATRSPAVMSASLSDEGGFEDDAAVDHPGCPGQHGLDRRRHFRGLAELPQDVDQSPQRPDQIAFVSAEGLLHDARPVVLARGPPEHRGHEARGDADGHGEVMVPLDFEHGVVPQTRDELALGQELAVLHGAESLEHGHDPAELLPVGVLESVEHLALLPEPSLQCLDALPGMIAAALAAPRTTMALDGGE